LETGVGGGCSQPPPHKTTSESEGRITKKSPRVTGGVLGIKTDRFELRHYFELRGKKLLPEGGPGKEFKSSGYGRSRSSTKKIEASQNKEGGKDIGEGWHKKRHMHNKKKNLPTGDSAQGGEWEHKRRKRGVLVSVFGLMKSEGESVKEWQKKKNSPVGEDKGKGNKQG